MFWSDLAVGRGPSQAFIGIAQTARSKSRAGLEASCAPPVLTCGKALDGEHPQRTRAPVSHDVILLSFLQSQHASMFWKIGVSLQCRRLDP
jgi:hypothetical protein